MPAATASTTRGVVASVGASALFAVLYVLPEMLDALSPNEVFAWRVIATVPLLTALLLLIREWKAVRAVARRIRLNPLLVLVLVVDAALLGVQLWLFGWAPAAGHGLEVALGYFLMPLFMVVVGVTVHRERLSWLRGAAVAAAACGVGAALLAGGTISWATLTVALGYPVYFVIRRRARLDTSGALWFELALMLPVAVFVAVQPQSLATVFAHPDLILPLILLGVVSSTALAAYMLASRLLSFSLFGLLTYVEPVLLVVVAVVLLGETVPVDDYLVYGAIAVAILLLAVEGALASRRLPRLGDGALGAS